MHSPTDDLRDLRAVFSAEANLSVIERAVMACLLLHRNGQTGRCDPSVTRITESTGMGRRTVMRVIAALEAAGHIACEHRHGTRTRYTVRVPTSATAALVPESHQCQSGTQLVPERHTTSARAAPERTKNERRNERSEIVDRLWAVYTESMNGSGLNLTAIRKQKLGNLYDEHLKDAPDPLALFGAILATVKADEFRMKTRSYHMVESLFLNPERREARAIDGRNRMNGHQPNGKPRNPMYMTPQEIMEWSAR
jgi:hypothetical protein